MVLTRHAKERWVERFSNLYPEYEYSISRKPTKAELRDITKQCPQHISIMKRKSLYGMSYRLNSNGVVFVCNGEGIIVTVFPYYKAPSCKRTGSYTVYRKGKKVKRQNSEHSW